MRNINLFVEDVAHEDFLTALIQRFADAHNIKINIKPSSVRGGHGSDHLLLNFLLTERLYSSSKPAACRLAAGSQQHKTSHCLY